MKNFFITLSLIISINANAGLTSPFPSSISELSTPNSHFVDQDEKIIRGMTPKNLQELKDFDVKDIVIFKSQTRKEVDKEIKGLKAIGYKTKNIHHIPFRWKGFESYQVACEQTIQALKIIKKNQQASDGKVFFHCTVGEDRTGYLAALFRMMDQNWTAADAFQNEMCENGYGKGNPRKPWKVYGAIRKELTPLFLHMSELITSGQLSMNNLDESICHIPVQQTLQVPKCENSSRLPSHR